MLLLSNIAAGQIQPCPRSAAASVGGDFVFSHASRRLRNQEMRGDAQLGMSVSELASKYDLGINRVEQILYGSAASKPRKDSAKREKRWNKIRPLFEQDGLTAKEISKRIRVPFMTVVGDLVRHFGSCRQPKLERYPGLRERDQKIAVLASDPSATLEGIAKQFGITRERVRQIINRLIRRGELDKSPRQKRSAMVRISALRSACRNYDDIVGQGVVNPLSVGERARYISREEFESAMIVIDAQRARCEKCGKKIVRGIRCRECRANDPEFRAADHSRRWSLLEAGKVKHKSPLHSEIKTIERSDMCGIFRSEAQSLSGLTDMQFLYLSTAGLFSKRLLHPERPREKGNFFLYSEFEMRQIGKIVQRFKNKSNGRH